MSEASELESILTDQVNRLLSDQVDKAALEGAETGVWPEDLWSQIEENGLPRVLVPEERGGVGGGWVEAQVVLRAAGRYQAPVPLAESVLAGWLLSTAELDMPDGVISVAPVGREETLELDRVNGDWKVSGVARRVPWGAQARYLAVLAQHDDECYAVLMEADDWENENDTNIAAEPRTTCRFEYAPVLEAAPVDLPVEGLYFAGAMARSAQIAGALEFVLEQSVNYANERVQFGKPIGKFQAVQQELARLAGEVAAAGAAAEAAAHALDAGNAGFEIAVAKARASEAASIATSIAHQTHGAIGFTYEHALHFATRRLWSWRAEFGSETYWQELLGRELASRGADRLWPFFTSRGG